MPFLVSCSAHEEVVPSIGENIVARVETTGLDSRVDVLFVVDTSSSMVEEQENFGIQIQEMARELVAPSNPEVPPVRDVRIGVISSD